MRLLAIALAFMASVAAYGINIAAAEEAFASSSSCLSAPSAADDGGYILKPHHFAVKTNLLFDAALMPNLEAEWLINDHWSAGLEGDVAWWKPAYNKVYRLAMVSPEGRYHFRPRGPWHGLYAGVFLGGGLYQLEWCSAHGYRGEGGMAGLSVGYMWPIGRHFFMEAGLGAGYMHTRYKVYENRDDHKLYLRTKSLNYFGPLKLKLSIAWRFNVMTKKVKADSTL